MRLRDDYAAAPELTDGEASNPGPPSRRVEENRAARAAVRAASAPEGIRHRPAAETTRQSRAHGLRLFLEFLRTRGRRWPARDPEVAARWLAEFGDHWFRMGGTIGEYRSAVAAIAEERRAWRPWLTEAWDTATNWELREPTQARVPLPEPGYRAGVAATLLWGWTGLMWYLLLGWHAALRPGEALRLRRRDLTLPSDLLSRRPVAFLRLPGTKTAGLSRWIASVQHARIESAEVVALMEAELGELPPRARLVDLTRAQLAEQWRLLFARLGFPVGRRERGLVPSSLRAGGATELYVATQSFEAARVLLRHAVRSRATERYVQEAVAALAHARLAPERRELVFTLGSVAGPLIRARTRAQATH